VKRKIDSRSVTLYAAIIIATLLLLGLVSASFGGSTPGFGMIFVPLLFGLLPLVAIITALFMLFGKSNIDRTDKPANSLAARILAALTISGSIIGIIVTHLSTSPSYAFSRTQFVLENTGVGAIFVAGVAAALLVNTQKFVYFPLWSKSDKAHADERQVLVRQRVFEKAYRYFIGALLLASWAVDKSSHIIVTRTLWVVVILCLSIPALIAAWQKDS
jgi:hypothetical protein